MHVKSHISVSASHTSVDVHCFGIVIQRVSLLTNLQSCYFAYLDACVQFEVALDLF